MMILKKIKPMQNRILVTMDMLEDKDMMLGNTGLIDASKIKMTIKDVQKIVAIGPMTREVKEGDLVCLCFKRFIVSKQKAVGHSVKENIDKHVVDLSYDFSNDIIELDGEPYLMLFDNDVKYIIEDYQEHDANPAFVIPEKKLETLN